LKVRKPLYPSSRGPEPLPRPLGHDGDRNARQSIEICGYPTNPAGAHLNPRLFAAKSGAQAGRRNINGKAIRAAEVEVERGRLEAPDDRARGPCLDKETMADTRRVDMKHPFCRLSPVIREARDVVLDRSLEFENSICPLDAIVLARISCWPV
jgi:hypothetical protein